MRTTLNLDADLLKQAQELTKIDGKTEVIHAGLRALVADEARKRLADLGGTQPRARMPVRRRT
ncbi:MAG: type II toxin-antitoxin system VapB family antitoxin [Clostridia bacterium]|nr:type II toxin-antitoxin system VapB family antitoxin [Deltaproteobacteria bacterium]